MSTISQEEKNFLLELHTMTGGDVAAQVSMYDVGTALGLDKSAVTALSQDLMIEDLVELKSLSGTIGITDRGLTMLEREGLIAGAGEQTVRLSKGPVIDDQDRRQIENLLADIKTGAVTSPSDYAGLEELVIDIKTMEVHLLSPRPKTAVLRALLHTIQGSSCFAAVSSGIADRISRFLGN